jgi:hypothetical protein
LVPVEVVELLETLALLVVIRYLVQLLLLVVVEVGPISSRLQLVDQEVEQVRPPI